MGKLSALGVSKFTARGYYGDGDGLWLQITATGARSWVYRYRAGGRQREMGLGSAKVVTLARAREKALTAARARADGIDPIEQRQLDRQAAELTRAKQVTFQQAGEAYIATRSDGWKSAKHRGQWSATLRAYAYPLIGSVPVAEVNTNHILQVLEPIWSKKPETASRVRGRLEVILDAARVRGQREGENPARWRGHLDKLLTAKSKVRAVAHHTALPFPEIAEFLGRLRAAPGCASQALEFAILTATRTSEVLGACWAEIDLDRAVWTIPAARMKAGRELRVPLSPPALALLKSRSPKNAERDGWCFPGASPGRPLSNMAMLKTLERLGRGDLTVHGFRSTFRDWAAETTAYPGEVVEMALAHSVKSKVEAAYRRGDLLEKRRGLMDDWASYIAG